MKFYVGLHTHRHGVSAYLFEVPDGEEMTVDDFASWLGADYEPDRGDEFLDLTLTTPFTWSKED